MAVSTLVALEVGLAFAPRWLAWRYRVAPGVVSATTVVVIGDSVPFGYGLPPGQGWGAKLGAALAAVGSTTAAVRMNAHPGADLNDAERQVFPCGAGVVYVSMLGHNNFIFHDDLVRGTRVIDTSRPRPVAPAPFDRLRVVRLALWAWDRAGGLGVDFEEGLRTRAEAGYRDLAARVRQCGGTLVTLTYVVPGPPPADAPQADHLAQATAGQRRVNEHLRSYAAREGDALVDLEYLVPVAPTWTPDEFLDAVHPTAALQERIAASLAEQLVGRGLAPP